MAQENKIRIRFVINDQEAQAQLGRVSQQLMEIGEKTMRLGTMMSAAVTAPIVGAFYAAVKGSTELQAALQPIKDETAAIAKEFGDSLVPVIKELMPDIKKVLGYVLELVRKFAELDTDSKERIVKLAIAIASLGPALMITGQLMSFVGIIGKIGSTLGLGAIGGGAAGGAGAAAAGGGVTAAVAGFGTALSTVVLPLTAVIGLAVALYKILEKIGAIKAAGETIKNIGGIARAVIGQAVGGPNVDPNKLGAYVTGGMSGLQNYGAPQTGTSTNNNAAYPNVVRYQGGQPITVNVQANSVVGTSKDLATALKPAIYDAFRQLGLVGAK